MVADLVIAGLSVAAYDAMKSVGAKKFAPSGELFSLPAKWAGYPKDLARKYQEMMRDRILKLPEDTPVSLMLAYVDYGDASTAAFVNAFAPFALVRPIQPMAENAVRKQERQAAANEYVEYLAEEARELRTRASRIGELTHIRNVSPFLLPYTNFDSRHHREMVDSLFRELGTAEDVAALMQEKAKELAKHHPRVHPPGQDDSCYCDGNLYFRSPGRHRHGFFRHSSSKEHSPTCLLAARSRFGGSFHYNLHYDCMPVRSLAANYPNCHGEQTAPREKHANICPNDFVI